MQKTVTVSQQDILKKLDFIGEVGEHQKISFSKLKYQESSSNYASIERFFTGESRNTTFNQIDRVVRQAIEELTHLQGHVRASLLGKLRRCKDGIQKLILTYDDSAFTSSMKTVIMNIDLNIPGSPVPIPIEVKDAAPATLATFSSAPIPIPILSHPVQSAQSARSAQSAFSSPLIQSNSPSPPPLTDRTKFMKL